MFLTFCPPERLWPPPYVLAGSSMVALSGRNLHPSLSLPAEIYPSRIEQQELQILLLCQTAQDVFRSETLPYFLLVLLFWFAAELAVVFSTVKLLLHTYVEYSWVGGYMIIAPCMKARFLCFLVAWFRVLLAAW